MEEKPEESPTFKRVLLWLVLLLLIIAPPLIAILLFSSLKR